MLFLTSSSLPRPTTLRCCKLPSLCCSTEPWPSCEAPPAASTMKLKGPTSYSMRSLAGAALDAGLQKMPPPCTWRHQLSVCRTSVKEVWNHRSVMCEKTNHPQLPPRRSSRSQLHTACAAWPALHLMPDCRRYLHPADPVFHQMDGLAVCHQTDPRLELRHMLIRTSVQGVAPAGRIRSSMSGTWVTKCAA